MTDFRIDHVHLRSPDPQEAAKFYIAMFGATETSRVPVPNGIRIILDLGGLPVFIEQVPAETHRAPAAPFVGMEHLGLAVSNIDAVVAELQAKGAVFTMALHAPRPGLKIAFVQAPDGVQVEILDRNAN